MAAGDKIHKERLGQRVETEIDIRLQMSCEIWNYLDELKMKPDAREKIAGLLRLAYVQGYTNALVEPERGQMLKSLGAKVPKRG